MVKGKLVGIVLSLFLVAGCCGEKARRFWRLVELDRNFEYGLKNYYTKAEKRQHYEEARQYHLRFRKHYKNTFGKNPY